MVEEKSKSGFYDEEDKNLQCQYQAVLRVHKTQAYALLQKSIADAGVTPL